MLTLSSHPLISVSQVVEKPGRSWIPPESMYSIIYELEYIESSKGVYHSTEGFLRLLRALFGTAGSSQELGSVWRARPGCTPYIEYVTRFVLPRATGLFQGSAPLQFRSTQDRDRLVALSLEVVMETISKYLVFAPSNVVPEAPRPADVTENYRQLLDSSLEALGMRSLVSDIVVEPSIQDSSLFMLDWMPSQTQDIASSANSDAQTLPATFEDQNTPLSLRRTMGNSSPRPKSAALSVFVDLLHESGGILLRSVVRVIVESTMQQAADVASDRASLAFALFNGTPPTLAGAKHPTTGSLERSISPLQDDPERLCSGSAADWGERAILAALKAVCAALVRESTLIDATNSSLGTGSIVPVLSFRSKSQGVSHPEVGSLKLTRLSQLLMSLNSDSGVLCSIISLVGYVAVNESRDVSIGQASTSIVLCMNDALPIPSSIARFYPSIEGGEAELARAFGTRLSVSGARVESVGDAEIVRVILNRLLCELRKSVLASESTCYAMLGFPSSPTGSWTEPSSHEANSFTALVYLLNDDDFNLSPLTAELAPMVFEVFARLMTAKAGEVDHGLARIKHTAGRLRTIDFWGFHLSRILSHFGSDSAVPYDYLMHSAAWLLKSLANEVDFLRGYVVGNPQLVQLEQLVAHLCAPPSEVLASFVRLLPLRRPEFDASAIKPPEAALAWAKAKLTGAPEVVEGFDIIRLDLFRSFEGFRGKPSVDEMEAWCHFWNAVVARDCSTSHLSSALYLVLGSMLVSERGLASRVPAIQRGLNGLLIEILGRLSVPNIDSTCFSTATRNLSQAALAVTRESLLCSNATRWAENNFDGALIRSMAVTALVSSSSHLDVSIADSFHQERTALLGTVLSLLLENASSFDLESTAPAFVDAATVLAALSLDLTSRSSGSLATPTNTAAIARDCLSVMFCKLHDAAPASGRQTTFVQSVLFHSFKGEDFMMRYMRLVRNLDGNLTRLLLSISSHSNGCQLLLDSGIIDALVEASERYKEEESMALSIKTVGSMEVEAPAFFLGHVELLVAVLMNALHVDQDYALSNCARFLSNYELVLARIVTHFPRTMPFVQQVSRLYLAVKHVSQRPQELQLMSQALEHKWLALAFNLACFPLPDIFLSALPEPLRVPAKGHAAVTFSNDVDQSWWGSVDADPGIQSLDARQRAAQMCSYATDAAEVAKALLWAFLNKPSDTARFDSRLISSCLCRCCDALQVRAG